MKPFVGSRALRAACAGFIALLFFVSCSKDDNASGSAAVTFKLTDAPVDDASVTGAFVTIADIKLDGQSLQGFTKTTVDIRAFQNGATHTLGTYNLESKTYSSITFVLDYDTDASGASPGCYVVTNGSVKHKLQSSTNSISVSKSTSLSGATTLVADFDLRKMIIRQTGGGADQYDFAAAAGLQTAIRVVTEGNSGTISGTLSNNLAGTGKVIAYAYRKGTFNRSAEMQGSGSVQFQGAVSSSVVNSNGQYQLHFLESGDYEIHFANYTDSNADGQWELNGTLLVLGSAGIDLLNLGVTARATVTANVTATAILP